MPIAFNRIRIMGTLPGGEVWSVNPTFSGGFGNEVVGFEALNDWAEAVAALNGGGGLPFSLRQMLSDGGRTTTIRAEYINATGQLAAAGEALIPNSPGGQGSPTKPFQTALVTSLLTGRPGRSYRGRLFWPALGAEISGTTLRVAVATTQTIADDVALFLREIANAAPGATDMNPAVVSQTADAATQITQVRVGNVLDVQRRRRDNLVEAYAVAPVSPS